MKWIVPALALIAFPAHGSEVWLSTGYIYTGDKYDRETGLDTRIRLPFEVQWKGERAYFELGGLRGAESYGSYTFIGGGVSADPFPRKVPWLEVQFGVEFGRTNIHSSEPLRFKIGVYYGKCKWRIGWVHRSNGRAIFNLGKDVRNHEIEGVFVGYRVNGDECG